MPIISRSWKKSLHSKIFILPKLWEASLGKIAHNRLLINKSVFKLIIDFSSIIRNRQDWKAACRPCKDARDRSALLDLIGSRRRLCNVFPVILKAAIPVGAAWKTGFPRPALAANSYNQEQIFRRVYVFPDPATPSIFNKS